MTHHTRFVVKIGDEYLGTKRFNYKAGTHEAIGAFEKARIFTRRQDANSAANAGETIEEVVVLRKADFENLLKGA